MITLKQALRPSAVAPLFYFGTLISSVGSFAFNVALIAFMLQSGFAEGIAAISSVALTSIWQGGTTNYLLFKD